MSIKSTSENVKKALMAVEAAQAAAGPLSTRIEALRRRQREIARLTDVTIARNEPIDDPVARLYALRDKPIVDAELLVAEAEEIVARAALSAARESYVQALETAHLPVIRAAVADLDRALTSASDAAAKLAAAERSLEHLTGRQGDLLSWPQLSATGDSMLTQWRERMIAARHLV